MPFYITTAISYVNGAPHLGHAYEAIATDVIARHHRQRGEDVFFLTGTDEHGEPVADAAAAEGVEPQQLADRNAQRFRALMPQLEVSNDYFIRTSEEQHKQRVQAVLQRVLHTRVPDSGRVRMRPEVVNVIRPSQRRCYQIIYLIRSRLGSSDPVFLEYFPLKRYGNCFVLEGECRVARYDQRAADA